MPLIKAGEQVENAWSHVTDEEDIPPGGQVTVSVSRFLETGPDGFQRNTAVGVRLQPADEPKDLLPHIERLSLIEVDFPKYTDGRGFSQAQLLRRRYGYAGELRAVGHVLRDQILYMHRSGFDAFETSRAELPAALDALAEYSAFYQRAADGAKPVFAARRATGA
ncbi:MAG: DUF934 domain-containing protein [Pseudomonadota bacterium]